MRTLLLTAVIVLSGCGVGVDTEDVDALKKSPQPAAPTYALKTTDAVATSPTWKSTFPISSTNEIDFATEIGGVMSGHHRLTIFVTMPDGFSYQRIDVSFATDVAAAAGEQQAQKTSSGWRVWAAVPVAGTLIQSANLSGAWAAQVWVDSASVASASATFMLQ